MPDAPPTGRTSVGRRSWIALSAIVALALTLRLWGLDYGLPHPWARPDENRITDNALRMVAQRTLHPGEFIYPSLQKYLCAAALEVHFAIACLRGRCTTDEFVELVDVVHPRLYYRTCRLVSVLTGVATVPLVFALGRRVSGQTRVGLIAALLLAVCYLHVRDSHFATVDVTTTFGTTVCLLLALEAARTGRTALFAAAGLAAGLAAAAKYNAAVVCIAIAVAAWAALRRWPERPAGEAVRWLAVGAAMAVLGFLIGVPYAIPEHAWMLGIIAEVSAELHRGHGPTGFEIHLLHSLPGGLGWPLYVAGVAGIGRAVWRRRVDDWVWLSFALAYFVMVGRVQWVVPRYVIPLVPILVVCAADLVVTIGARSRTLVSALLLSLVVPTLWRSIEFDRVAHRPDTRVMAADWIAANLPARSRIALCEGYGMPVLHGNRPGRMPFLPKPTSCGRSRIAALRASYLVTHEHPVLGWSAPPGHFQFLLADQWRPIAAFDPFSSSAAARAYYHDGDAFYVPYTGLETVTRGGPIITVWEKVPSS